MNSRVSVALDATPEQFERLLALQRAFAEVCNALAPLVQSSRVWNRVALHHMAYRSLRERFPALGSQMVCNAIYSVSRACRLVFQTPGSPFHVSKLADRPLPLLNFTATAPVYFDRHTLSLKPNELSMFTLDGRLRFQLAIDPSLAERFRHERLRELVLARGVGQRFVLTFHFGDHPADDAADQQPELRIEWPDYLMIKETC
jgi:hypothetical protein